VDDVTAAYKTVPWGRGAISVASPTLLEDESGVYEFASIKA